LQLYLLGKHIIERREVAAIRRLLAPGMVVADIGANVGFYTLQMALGVGPTGRVLAFEPDPFCFEWLQYRIKQANAINIEAHQVALGEGSREAVLYSSRYNRADNRIHRSHNEPNVERHSISIRRLDEFLPHTNAGAVDALKIDVQGAEEYVLRGAQHTFHAGITWIWIEFSPPHLRGAGTDPKHFLALLDSLKMELFEIDPWGHFQRLSDPEDYIRRIGDGYGDLLLTSPSHCRRWGLRIPTSPGVAID
jgi:FkbM family methyltransferase